MPTNTGSVVDRGRRAVILPTAMASLWSRSSMLGEFWDIVQAVGAWSGAAIIQSPGGLKLTLNGVQLGQLKWGGRLVLTLAPEARNAILAEKMARSDPDRPGANTVVFDVRGAGDVNQALSLLRFAYLTQDLNRDKPSIENDFPRLNFARIPIPLSNRFARARFLM